MATMNMDEIMGNRDYTLIIDGTAPMGMAKYRYEPTQEIVYVVINEELANNANTNNNTQEETTMDNNTQATTTNTTSNSKKNTKKRIGFIGNMIIAGALAASKGTGYGVGYATETIKDEACYYGKKIKNAVCGTKAAQAFSDGYYNGKNDAYYAFTQRANKREERVREKMDNKAVKAAANEMFEDIFC